MSKPMRSILSKVETEIFTSMIANSSNQEIADSLGLQNSYVRKVKSRIRKKLVQELSQVANTLRLQFTDTDIDREKGILKCFDWVNNTWVILIFTPFKGIIAYYDHDCTDNCQKTCDTTLDDIIKERNIHIGQKIRSLPTRLQYEYVIETIRKKGV